MGSAADEFAMLSRLLRIWDSVDDAASRAGFSRHDVLCNAVGACIASADMLAATALVEQELAACPPDDVVGHTWLELQLLSARAWRTPLGRAGLAPEEIIRHAAVLRRAPNEKMVVDGLVMLAGRTLADDAKSEELFTEARRRAAELGNEDLELYSWATAARRKSALQRPDEAVGIYERALSRDWLRLAERHLTHGNRATAAKHLEEARLTAQQLGAHPLQSQIDGLCRRAGIRIAGQPPTPERPLTLREHEVLEQLATGRTNAQIAAAALARREGWLDP
jgi:hypothetical protein